MLEGILRIRHVPRPKLSSALTTCQRATDGQGPPPPAARAVLAPSDRVAPGVRRGASSGHPIKDLVASLSREHFGEMISMRATNQVFVGKAPRTKTILWRRSISRF